ncbi:MAG: lectin-like protein [Methylobacter sp.]|nr:lectin-like protein [Methylobacter sp.]
MATYQYNGHTYLLTTAGTWQEAQASAQSLGGNLVTINNQAEQDWLIATFGNNPALWLGYTDQETEGVFKWVNGESSTFTNWDTIQPDNRNGNEDYVMLTTNNGKWNDVPNSPQGSAPLGIIEISSINSAPTATNLNAAETYTEDTALNLTDIVVTDTDSASVTATLTLSDTAAGSLNTGTSNSVTSTYSAGVWTADGAIADVNTLLAGLIFTPATNFNSSFTLATSISDSFSTVSDSKSFAGTAVNDAPTATALNTAETYTEDSAINLTDIVAADSDNATLTATLTLSNPAAGSLNIGTANSVTSAYSPDTGIWTATGATADVNILLAGLSFSPAANFNNGFTIATSISDGLLNVSGSKTFTGSAVNDAPTATSLSAAEAYTENAPLNLTDIVATDADSATITATLTLSNPTAGSLNTDTSNSVTSSYYAGTGVWSVSGASADVNALLANLVFTPTTNFNGNFTIADNISDGSLSVSGSKSFTGTPVNSAPTATALNSTESYTEDTALNLTDLVAADVDSATITATLTLSNPVAGRLSTGSSNAVTSSYNAGTGVWTAAGATADVNVLLAGLSFTPAANFNSGFTIATQISDGSLIVSGSKSFTGTAVADAPTATALNSAETYTEDEALNLTDLVATDVDSATITATLTLSNPAAGSLNTGTSNTATSTYNSAGAGVWTVSGASADVNALLANLSFTPTANFNSSFTISTTIGDGVLSVSGSKNFTGIAANDAPTATALNSAETYTEDTALNLTNIVANDIDSPVISATLTLSNLAAGSLSTGTSNAVTSSYNAGTGVWTANGAVADVNTLLAGLSFTPAANFNSSFTIATDISDDTLSVSGSKNFTGIATNDAPTGTVSITGTAAQGQKLTVGNTLADTDGLGTIAYQWQANGVAITGATAKTYTLTQTEVGKTISVAAHYTDKLGTVEHAASTATAAVLNVNDLPTGKVTIAGTAKKGEVLTASNTLADTDGLGLITYQWRAGAVTIGTGNTYTLTANEIGKTVTATATYTDAFGTAESVSSASSGVVIPPSTPGVTISPATAQTTGENGASVTYKVQLNTAPAVNQNVVVTFASNDASEGIVTGKTTFTFTSANYSTPQTLTVSGVDDYLDDGNIPYEITATISSRDVFYKNVTVTPLSLTNTDDGLDSPLDLYGDQGGDIATSDVLIGGNGADILHGLNMADNLSGGRGNDTLLGGNGDDNLFGEEGNDDLYGEQENDYLDGGVGNDTLDGGDGLDTLMGGEGNDSLDGGKGVDSMEGGAGNDTLDGGDKGADFMTGGEGNDIYYLGYDAIDVIADNGLATDQDTVIMPYLLQSYTLPASIENGTIAAGAKASNLTGNDSDNALSGNDGNNVLDGAVGRDSLFGGSGNDELLGGLDNDTLVGGNGSDSLEGGNGNDSVNGGIGNDLIVGGNGIGDDIYIGGAGIDTIKYSSATTGITVSLALGTAGGNEIDSDQLNSIENVIGGQAGDVLTGDAGNNVLDGFTGNDTLSGGAGNDTMIGGLGNDTYFVDKAGDVVTETSALAIEIDTVNSSTTYTLKTNIENLTLSGTAAINGIGNSLNNALTGNKGANALTGGTGADTLTGGLGSDQFKFNSETETGVSAGTRDSIVDFSHSQGDKINLSAIDANTAFTGNNAFSAPTVGGTFSGVFANSGELYFDKTAQILYGNNDADNAADFSIQLAGVSNLVATDFVL